MIDLAYILEDSVSLPYKDPKWQILIRYELLLNKKKSIIFNNLNILLLRVQLYLHTVLKTLVKYFIILIIFFNYV